MKPNRIKQRQGNTDKCHLLLSKNYEILLEVAESFIKNRNFEKLLGVNIYKKIQ